MIRSFGPTSLIAYRRLQRETLHKTARGNGLFPDGYYCIHCGLFSGGGGVVIEQVNGKILPPFHERLQALVDEHGITRSDQIGCRSKNGFRLAVEKAYLQHNRDLVIDLFIDSTRKDSELLRDFLMDAFDPLRKRIHKDFRDYWYCGTNEEVVAAGTRGDVDPLEPAKDLAEMRAKDVIKEARG